MKAIGTLLLLLLVFAFASITIAATSEILRPTADGGDDSASWSTGGGTACNAGVCYTEVDESSGGSCTNSDGDTTYITSSTNGATQTFNIDVSGVTDGATITQIDVTFCAKRNQGGAQLQARYCVDSSCTNSGSNYTPGNSYGESTQSFSSLSINKSSGTDIEIGALNNSAKSLNVSQIAAVVTYSEPAGDTTAPNAVSDLAASVTGQTTIDLSWTAPGDDGGTGTATTYDIRYSTSEITAGNFDSATQANGEPSPAVAGSSESFTVTGLSANTTYYFAIKTSDEVPNTSSISNVVNATTSAAPDTTAPSGVLDLSVVSSVENSIDLSWTAPGDDADSGTATSYDVRYATAEINESAWGSSTQATDEPSPSIAGTSESFTVTGLMAGRQYYFAIKTTDESANESIISNSPSATTDEEPEQPNLTVSGDGGAARSISISGYVYPGATIELLQRNENEIGFRNIPIQDVTIQNDGTFFASIVGLASGNHFIALRIKDKFGNNTGILSLSVDFLYSGDRFVLDEYIAPPTIGFKKRTLFARGVLEVEGYASPNAAVTLKVGDELSYEIVASDDGYWRAIEETGLPVGVYSLRAFQTLSDETASSSPSTSKTFRVSDLLHPEADFNDDGTVDITDWSLFLFRWGSKENNVRTLIDLDESGSIDVGDFSIFLRAMKL